MTTQKESTSLFIGNAQSTAKTTLFLNSVPEGIKYFNSWDGGLTSLETTNERFESKFSNQILGREYSCNSIKIVDDVAAISYGNYTDLNKVLVQETNGGLYQPWEVSLVSYNTYTYRKISNDWMLPIVSKGSDLLTNPVNGQFTADVDFSNMFILVEYDGYFTSDTGYLETRDLGRGSFELFRYIDTTDDPTGVFYFSPEFDYVFLRSKYAVNHHSLELRNGISSSRLLEDHVTIDIDKMSHNALDMYQRLELAHIPDLTYGFVGYKKVSVIRYTPVVECGKIDLYTRLSGRITQELSRGSVTSVGHGLKNGDMIKIAGARNIYGKDPALNGLKYVQVNTTDIFTLYNDPEMTQRVDTVSGTNPDASWICVGNVYSEILPDGWKYQKSLFSPTGRNGYTLKTGEAESLVTYGSEINTPLDSSFNECNDSYDIVVKDLGYVKTAAYDGSVANETVVYDAFSSLVPVRAYPSLLDAQWAKEENYLSGCQFGCSIDFKLINGQYYLLVGERGIDEYYTFGTLPLLPANSPYGKMHLFTVSVNASKVLSYTYVDTIYSYSGDTDVSTPDYITQYIDASPDYIDFCRGAFGTAQSIASNPLDQIRYLVKGPVTKNFTTNDYWFGAYLYHQNISGPDYNGQLPYTSVYFGNFCPPDLSFEYNYDFSTKTLQTPNIYPYCDSFGKSVALGNIGVDIFLFASSKVKTVLYPIGPVYSLITSDITNRELVSHIGTPYDPAFSATDCGYVHFIKFTGGPTTVAKISNTGRELISGGIDPQYLKAEKFANTIQEFDGIVYFGSSNITEFYDMNQPRPTEPDTTSDGILLSSGGPYSPAAYSSVDIFTNEDSKIYLYKYYTSYIELNSVITKPNEGYYYIQDLADSDTLGANQKELKLRNQTARNERVYGHVYYNYGDVLFTPSDRFGDFFRVGKNLIVANSLSIYNELGTIHSDLSGYSLPSDYMNVYNNVNGQWTFITKLSASIDTSDSRYSYADLVISGAASLDSLRALENRNYANGTSNSKTWDIDLTNAYVVSDGNIVIKDPYGYSIFSSGPDKSIRPINCIYNKVVSYAYNTLVNNYSVGESVYTNPVLGIGTSQSISTNSARLDEDGPVSNAYQIMALDNYGVFSSTKMSGSNLLAASSIDISPLQYLPLFMSTPFINTDDITLSTTGAYSLTGSANLAMGSVSSLGGTMPLTIGPANYTNTSDLYIYGAVADVPTSGSVSKGMNLNMPFTTRVVGTDSSGAANLYIKASDVGSNINLYTAGPTNKTGTTNLFILPKHFLATYDDNFLSLYMYGLYTMTGTMNLAMSANAPTGINLYTAGPLSVNNSVDLTMYSPTQDTTNNMTLAFYQTPTLEMPLFIQTVNSCDSNAPLFISYNPTTIDSITGGPSNVCGAYSNTVPFDVTPVGAESLINNTNSIASTLNDFGFSNHKLDITQLTSDYNFYRYGRTQKLTHYNGGVLVVGSLEGGYPKLDIYSVSGNEVTYVTSKSDWSSIISSYESFGDSAVLDVKVSAQGKVAISSYIEVKDASNDWDRAYFAVDIYDSTGTYINGWSREFTAWSEYEYLLNHMGATLLWRAEDLIYTKEDNLFGTIRLRTGPTYTTDEILIDYTNFPGYSTLYNNWAANYIPFYRLGLGHRMEIVGTDLFVTAPLASTKTLSAMSSPANVNFNGILLKYTASGSYYTYSSALSYTSNTINDYLFGYDLAPASGSILYVSEASTNKVIQVSTALVASTENVSSYKDFGISITQCNDVCYTTLNNVLYCPNTGLTLSYGSIDEEIAQYIPGGVAVSSKEEKILGSVVANGKHFAFREFNVTYGFGQSVRIRKVSLLKQSQQYQTPTLFLQSNGLSGTTPLYLQTINTLDNGATLYTNGAVGASNIASLHIENIPDNVGRDRLYLKLQGDDPVGLSDLVGLNVYGSSVGTVYFSGPATNLIIEGGSEASIDNNTALWIFGPSSATVTNTIPFFMNMGPADSGTTSATLGINIMNTSTVELNWMTKNSNATLFLNSTYGTTGSLPLWMVRKGPGGGEEVVGSAGLVLENKNIQSNVTIYTNAVSGQSGNVNLVFAGTKGQKDETMKLQVFGYLE